MKVSNHKCYYCTPYGWEFRERFVYYRRCRFSPYTKGGNHAEPQSYKNRPVKNTKSLALL